MDSWSTWTFKLLIAVAIITPTNWVIIIRYCMRVYSCTKGGPSRYCMRVYSCTKGGPSRYYMRVYSCTKGGPSRYCMRVYSCTKGGPSRYYMRVYSCTKGGPSRYCMRVYVVNGLMMIPKLWSVPNCFSCYKHCQNILPTCLKFKELRDILDIV